jgi:1-acyl-sn-glycerol-3-phosphate acyltransferase
MSQAGPSRILEMSVLYSLYVWIVGGGYFMVALLLATLLSFILPVRWFDPLVKLACRFLFRLMFVRVRCEGADQISSKQHYLYMANHVNMFDIPLVEGYLPGFVRGIEARRQFSWPVYGWAIRRMGNIPIDRENFHSAIQSIKKAAAYMKRGRSLLVLPEAHRTKDGNLQAFKRLPFRLAKESGIPVVPVALVGMFRLKQVTSWRIRRSRIAVRIGKPIDEEAVKSLSPDELLELVRGKISDLLKDAP